jgi:protein O-mannosyl-transferase
MKKKYIYLIIIILIVSSCITFGRIVNNGFINYDDNLYITENNYVKSEINPQNINWAFSAVVSGNWHPLTLLSHTLDWTLFGANASGHHLVSLLLHIGTVIFLFLFLNKTTNNIWPSAFAAAFFALHPLRVESVAWASERKDVLSMFFGIISLHAYAYYAEKTTISRYCLCLILFVLSLMSKPMMITLPFVLMLLDYWPLERWQKVFNAPTKERFNSASKLIWEKVPFICMTIASSIITLWAQNKDGSVAAEVVSPLTARAANAIVSYVAYLVKTFWPTNLAVFYPYEFSLPLWKVVISTIIVILIFSVIICYVKKLPFLFVGWLWYLGTLIPVIGLVQVGSQAMADRYHYLPSIGIAMILAWGIPSLIKNKNIRKIILFPASLVFLIIMSALTWTQCGYWKSDSTLFNHALRVTKNNYLAHSNLGASFFEKGNNNEALYHFNKAILIKPDYFYIYVNRGNTYYNLGQYQRVIEDYTKALSLKKDYADGYYTRGNVYYILGDYQKSIADYNNAIILKPDFAEAYNHRGTIYYNKLNQYQKSIEDYNNAIILKPDFDEAYENRAFVYLNNGDSVAGCRDAKRACELGKCTALMNAQASGLCR